MELYILENKQHGKFYIGTTEDLKRRIDEHNRPNKHFTGKIGGTWEIIFSRTFSHKTDALKEELRLKKAKNKNYLIWYIENNSRALPTQSG